jgi:hypothetical protein
MVFDTNATVIKHELAGMVPEYTEPTSVPAQFPGAACTLFNVEPKEAVNVQA